MAWSGGWRALRETATARSRPSWRSGAPWHRGTGPDSRATRRHGRGQARGPYSPGSPAGAGRDLARSTEEDDIMHVRSYTIALPLLAEADAEARTLGHSYIGPEHLLL